MNAPMYLALVLFGMFVFVQPNIVHKDNGIDNERKGKLVGDIMYTQEQYETGMRRSRRGFGFHEPDYVLWPNGTIPYAIDTSDIHIKLMIRKAMDEWQDHTCLNFTQHGLVNPVLRMKIVTEKQTCWSYTGRLTLTFAKFLSLGKDCWKHEAILHHLGRSIGLGYEHSRLDRDEYVTINDENVLAGKKHFFKKLKLFFTTFNTRYDYFSIMHFSADAKSKNGKDTITTKDPEMQKRIGHSKHLSFGDIKAVNIMYNCKDSSGPCPLKDSDCPDNGFVDKTCSCMCPLNGLDQFPVPCLLQSHGPMNGNASLISQ